MKLIKFLTILFTILRIINVEYIDVPINRASNKGYRQEVKIEFREGTMQIPRRRIVNEFIPYGKVKMINVGNTTPPTYKFIKIEEGE